MAAAASSPPCAAMLRRRPRQRQCRRTPGAPRPLLLATPCFVALVARPLLAQRLDTTASASSKEDDAGSFEAEIDGRSATLGVILDANYRWLYEYGADGSTTSTCSSSEPAEMEACYLQAVDRKTYQDTYGIDVKKRDVELRFASMGKYATKPNYGSRVFVTDMTHKGPTGYHMFNLLDTELSVTLDLSKVPAGMNAAVYFVSMDAMGNKGATYASGESNEAGWERGVGYCDAQCPTDLKFVQGAGYNPNSQMESCCAEFDLFEGNRLAAQMTAHPCTIGSEAECNENTTDCTNPCDTDGADINLFRTLGPSQAFFERVDLQRPVIVRTKFITNEPGNLVRIEQLYEQESKKNGVVEVLMNMTITDESIAKQKKLFEEDNAFERIGGLAQMGAAMSKGMVMTLAIWTDSSKNMNWLDSCCRNETIYNCSEHPILDSKEQFWKNGSSTVPGSWRGPVDYYADYATSFASRPITLSYPSIPLWMKTQDQLECIKTLPDVYDCSRNTYGFTVSNIKVRSLNISHIPWLWICIIVAVVGVAGGFIVLNVKTRKARAKGVKKNKKKGPADDSSDNDSSTDDE